MAVPIIRPTRCSVESASRANSRTSRAAPRASPDLSPCARRGVGVSSSRETIGRVEQAEGGTLFIDEIGELPLTLQPRLLRFLERREIQRVGSNEQRAVDVRVVAATQRDLLLGINQQTFREDLHYRLAVMRLSIPPLRARIDDLELLVRTLLEEQLGSKEKAAVVLRSMSSAAWAALQAHRWRGNVRELRNVIERSLALSPQGPITLDAEPATPSPWAGSADAPAVDLSGPYIPQRERAVERFDRTYLAGLLKAHEGNYSRAAAVAGIDRMYFKRLVKKYEL